jgi:UDP-3-O-[3-hydroxymyristoyl] glucosamine N-acyltransferase
MKVNNIGLSLQALAQRLQGKLFGPADAMLEGLATLENAQSHHLSFLANPKYRPALLSTQAGCVLVSAADQSVCPVPCIVVDDPYLAYAKCSHWFKPVLEHVPGIHATAIVHNTATVAASAHIGPYVVIGARTKIAEQVVIATHGSIGADCVIGADSFLHPQVTCYDRVCLGERVTVHATAVIGADGFGFAPSAEGWQKIAQLGGVRVGDDVDIGAATTIDGGALDATEIGNGVIIDNQVQIAHNCRIGDHTAIAGCVGIAGSTTIGKRCTIAGAAGIAGHLTIADDVHIGMQAQVTKSITEAGDYASGTGLWPTRNWRKWVANARRGLK